MGCLHGSGEPERPEVAAGLRWPRALPSQAPARAQATAVGALAAAARLASISGGRRWRVRRHTRRSRTFLARGAKYGDGLPFSLLARCWRSRDEHSRRTFDLTSERGRALRDVKHLVRQVQTPVSGSLFSPC